MNNDSHLRLTKATPLGEAVKIILDRLIQTAENGPQPSAHHYPFAICVGKTPSCSTYIRASIVSRDGEKLHDKIETILDEDMDFAPRVAITIAAINAVINSREGGAE